MKKIGKCFHKNRMEIIMSDPGDEQLDTYIIRIEKRH